MDTRRGPGLGGMRLMGAVITVPACHASHVTLRHTSSIITPRVMEAVSW